MSVLGFLEWLAATPWSVALHESLYMYPLVESTHVLALTMFVGLAVMLDLRLLGWAFRQVPVSQFLARVLPWTKVGFAVMFVTGVLLFYAIPVRNYQNIFFRIKVVMLILAGLNVWLFHSRVEPGVAAWDLASVAPKAARVAAIVSLVLWAGIVVTGRMIAYNWFDCDIQPQPAFINWAAGCVIPPSSPAMTLLPFFEWCEAMWLGNAIRTSLWLFPVIEAVHLLGLCMLGGAVLMVDLRMLGVGLRQHPIARLARDARPWLLASIVVMLTTGTALFLSESVKCYYNQSFWVKITTLPVALLFTFLVRERVARKADLDATATTRIVALASLAMWFTVAAAGRWIGFS